MTGTARKKADGVRRRQADRSDHTIATLRAVALELLLSGGVAALNLAELGDRAGYSRGIVHYHFGSKEELLADLLRSLIDWSVKSFARLEAGGVQGLVQIIVALEKAAETRPGDCLARTLLLNEGAASNSRKLNELVAHYNSYIRAAIEKQVGNAPIFQQLGINASESSALILAILRGIHQQWLAEREAFDAIGALRAFRELVEMTLG